MMFKFMSIPTKYEVYNTFDSGDMGNLQKVKLYVMHEGMNYNGSAFTTESMEKAKESLKNVPILAYVIQKENGEEDFDGHTVETTLVEEDGKLKLKEYFLEKPIGIIPESNNYRIEVINGLDYVVCDGYIWKNYSNEAFDILSDAQEKKLSMEIKVKSGEFNTKGVYTVNDYTYLGVTLLGDHVPPAMGEHCRAIMQFSADANPEYFQAVEDLNKKLKERLESEVYSVPSNKPKDATLTPEGGEGVVVNQPEGGEGEVTPVVKEGEQPLEPEGDEGVPTEPEQPEGEGNSDNEPGGEGDEGDNQNFSLSLNNISKQVRETLKQFTFKEMWYGEEYEEEKYWEEDFLITENVAVLYDYQNKKYYGVPYTLEADEVKMDFDGMKEYLRTWKEKEFAIPDEMKFSFEERIEVLKARADERFSKVNEELEELRKFKADILDAEKQAEKMNEIENIVSEFSFEEEEIKEVKDKAVNGELTVEQFQKELFALEGMKVFQERKAKFSGKGEKKEPQKIQIPQVQPNDNENKPVYAELFEQYNIK